MSASFNRKTDFWKLNTPPKVGPGSYNLIQPKEIKPSSAPFSTGVKRDEPLRKSEIGPGSYLGNETWDKDVKGTSLLASTSPRMGPFATGISGFTMPTNVYNPGPGTYLSDSHSKNPKKEARRHSLTIDPTPISIPSKEKTTAIIGPFSYHPELARVRPNATCTTFGGYLSKRSVFEGNDEVPGPGEYTIESNRSKGFAFPKTVAKHKTKSSSPGPGTYELPTDRKVRKEPVECFGVLAKKDAVLSKNPHMPIQVGHTEIPPVGLYSNSEKFKNQEKLKQKFISYEAPIPKPPFNVSTERKMKWVDNPGFPGPGAYSESKLVQESEESTAFRSKVQKFSQFSLVSNPGPGAYEPDAKQKTIPKALSVFSSKTPRFSKVASDNLSVCVIGSQVNVELELSHLNWKAKQSRAFDAVALKPDLSFDSTANRFKSLAKNPQNPGPGHYDFRPNSVPTKVKRTSQRFGNFENYRPSTGTATNIGPGSYSANSQTKKSFNMSGELAKVRPWIN